jgi:hypothetical protein
MRKIARSEVLDLVEYEKARPEIQKAAIEAKRVRRVAVGPFITCFFENRFTMFYQLQEMLRVERVVREDAIADEMRVWNDLVPGDRELSMTLMVEITDFSKTHEILEGLKDLERHVFLRVGDRSVPARFEAGWSDENRISAVQFIRFALSPVDVERFKKESDVKLAIDHPRYQAETLLAPETLEALRSDLANA